MAIHIPDYVKMDDGKTSVKINGESVELGTNIKKGYWYLTRNWNSGDVIELRFDMPVRKVFANSQVRADAGLCLPMHSKELRSAFPVVWLGVPRCTAIRCFAYGSHQHEYIHSPSGCLPRINKFLHSVPLESEATANSHRYLPLQNNKQ